jgi:signal transduction histidine kinase
MEEPLILPAILTPDKRQKRLALIAALLVPIPFIAIIPFGQIELPRVEPYIPIVDTVMLINDSIAAALLFAQFSIVRSPSLLALAGGFLLTAFLVIPHALTFPGAFAPDGLLGAGLQTTPWLNEFWFLGLPTAIIAYVVLKSAAPIPRERVRFAIFATVMAAFLATVALLWLATVGVGLLPSIMSDAIHPQLNWHFVPIVVLSGVAMALLWRWRNASLDLWLLVMLEAWMLNALMFNRFVVRFSVFWYSGRIFAALAASIVLLFLLYETTIVYWRLALSHGTLERERHNKLMSLEAAAASISHELKQPLTAITANGAAALRLLELVPPDLEEARAALDDVAADGRRAGQVLDNLHALFGNSARKFEPMNLNEAALAALRALRGELHDHAVTANVELASDLPLVMGHAGQIQEVITNLFHNAIEAMDTVKVDRRFLKVRTKADGAKTIVAEIEDTGPGIHPEKLDGIFEAFVTTKPQGTGLGLAICRMIVERHGGQLAAVSNGKTGATFRLVLPIASTGNATVA